MEWCRGPLADLTGKAIDDPRVEVVVADVARTIRAAPKASLDAIVLDLYEGPHEATSHESASLYGAAALQRAWKALAPDGVLAIWSEDPNPAFERRLETAGFRARRHRAGKGGRAHIIYVGMRGASGAKPAGRRRDERID